MSEGARSDGAGRPPVRIAHAAGETWLKWHRGRRAGGDFEFDPRRILEGMRLGASVEVDLRAHAGDGFAVLHDEGLERATTGAGQVADASTEALRALTLRDNAGRDTGVPVALLGDLCRDLAQGQIGDGALLQLDLKETSATLTDADVAAFARDVGPVQRHVILSGGDATAVQRLAAALPGMQLGYDPCHNGTRETLAVSGDDAGFLARALAGAGPARMIYLDIRLILDALSRDFDMIGAFHAKGCRIDGYTVQRPTPQAVALCKRLMGLGVDQITTDDPEGLYAALTG
ncbi:cytoplasmic glycerophosphodiester phosphodiesterase [Pseudooceanicola marinus]|uniref:Cytoplasmic glycerophosphodiester phosphodiesterase n=2 Tax=Pseudooceanicola marinus TaxID=396013 RepID=A0A1X6ZD13_9RHOB|nr:glycerophosphodiester phosphodiesterase family protein [Pseudooceanicola marinus]PJE28278.1 glycerophosphodiester phosphodiesterase [Pseudooceanicola marinus]SLN47380.1 cytoplasmic glycerophosphodiester phosphodiesterase [Pseudooceanicola marinus]